MSLHKFSQSIDLLLDLINVSACRNTALYHHKRDTIVKLEAWAPISVFLFIRYVAVVGNIGNYVGRLICSKCPVQLSVIGLLFCPLLWKCLISVTLVKAVFIITLPSLMIYISDLAGFFCFLNLHYTHIPYRNVVLQTNMFMLFLW